MKITAAPVEESGTIHPSLLPALRRSQASGDQLAGAAADAIEALARRAVETEIFQETIESLCDRLEAIHSVACDDSIGYMARMNYIQRWSEGFMPIGGPKPSDCTRSHPHEEMSADCERLTLLTRERTTAKNDELVSAVAEEVGGKPV